MSQVALWGHYCGTTHEATTCNACILYLNNGSSINFLVPIQLPANVPQVAVDVSSASYLGNLNGVPGSWHSSYQPLWAM